MSNLNRFCSPSIVVLSLLWGSSGLAGCADLESEDDFESGELSEIEAQYGDFFSLFQPGRFFETYGPEANEGTTTVTLDKITQGSRGGVRFQVVNASERAAFVFVDVSLACRNGSVPPVHVNTILVPAHRTVELVRVLCPGIDDVVSGHARGQVTRGS